MLSRMTKVVSQGTTNNVLLVAAFLLPFVLMMHTLFTSFDMVGTGFFITI